jgi:hypothetical protein
MGYLPPIIDPTSSPTSAWIASTNSRCLTRI